jgi:hypothetical protein
MSMRPDNKNNRQNREPIKLRLPSPLAQPSPNPFKNLKPFTPAESRRCFATANPEFDALAAHCASLPAPLPEE